MRIKYWYNKVLITIYLSIFTIDKSFADISIGGNDHIKDFSLLSDIATTSQSLIFNILSKTAGTACGFIAIFFLCKRRWGLCALLVVCCICFFALKTLVTNFSNFAPAQGN